MNAEDLIAEVAKRRGVVLTVADPAIIVATVLELNLEQATKEIGTSGPGPVQIRRWRRPWPRPKTPRVPAQTVITSAGNWVAEQARTQMSQSLTEVDARMTAHKADIARGSLRALHAAAMACAAALFRTSGLVWPLAP
jgi:hypothetical protein